MKVLLTGANGFVGSHILDELCAREIPTVALLRRQCNQEFIAARLPQFEVRHGEISDPTSLRDAMQDITHVIHCAGATKGLCKSDFFTVNQIGTRNVVAAVNQSSSQIKRLVLISSLAAAGPTTPDHLLCETDPARPVSAYGESKLAGEREVVDHCKSSYTILRPPAIYGPRDRELLRLFVTIGRHGSPRVMGGKQALSMIYIADLVDGVLACLTHPAADRKTYFVSGKDVIQTRDLAKLVTRILQTWTLSMPIPAPVAWLVCLLYDFRAHLTGKANILGLQKYAELRAPAWICSVQKIQQDLGVDFPTSLEQGLAQTLQWYREQHWLV